MKKILSATLFATFFFAGSAKAEWDHWAVKALGPFDARGIGLYKVDSRDGSATLVGTRCDLDPGINTCYQQIGSGTYVDSETGKFYLENEAGDFISYDPDLYINSEAPIFNFSDYGLVGDLFDVLPKLEEKL